MPKRVTKVMCHCNIRPISGAVGKTDPLALTPLVPMPGRFIYAGVADRLVHPREEVTRLWKHWGRPQIMWYPSGHMGFFRSPPVQRFVRDALEQSGLLDGSPVVLARPV